MFHVFSLNPITSKVTSLRVPPSTLLHTSLNRGLATWKNVDLSFIQAMRLRKMPISPYIGAVGVPPILIQAIGLGEISSFLLYIIYSGTWKNSDFFPIKRSYGYEKFRALPLHRDNERMEKFRALPLYRDLE